MKVIKNENKVILLAVLIKLSSNEKEREFEKELTIWNSKLVSCKPLEFIIDTRKGVIDTPCW